MTNSSDPVSLSVQSHERFKNILLNAAVVFTGNTLSAVLNFVVLAIFARSLSVDEFAIISLMISSVYLLERFFGVQSCNAIIKHAAEGLRDLDKQQSLFYAGFFLDIVAGFVASAALISLQYQFGQSLGVNSSYQPLSLIFAIYLLFSWNNAPLAYFRLKNQFNVIVFAQNAGAVVRLVLTVLVLFGPDSLAAYSVAWVLGGVMATFIKVGLWVRQVGIGYSTFFLAKQALSTKKEFLKYTLAAYLEGIIRSVRDLDIFLVATMLQLSDVAIYKIARELAKMLSRLTAPFHQVILPDLASLIADRDDKALRLVVSKISACLGMAALVLSLIFVGCGEWLIDLVYGNKYQGAFVISVICMLSVVIWAFALPLSPALYALGAIKVNVKIHMITALLYISLLPAAIHFFQLNGAGVAILLFYLCWSLLMLVAFRTTLNTVDSNSD